MAKKNKKIIRLRTYKFINIGTIIFAFILLYLIISVVMYLSKERIQIYTVSEGSLAVNSDYTGIILRDETVYNTEYNGTVYYYMQEGQKTGVGDLVYSIDETGQMAELLAQQSADGNQLSEENLTYLKRMLANFSTSYDQVNFSDIYEVKYSIQAALLEYASMDAMTELNQALTEMDAQFQMYYAPSSGVVAYYSDGFEGVSAEQLTMDSFNKDNYEKQYFQAGAMVEAGTAVYKTVNSDQWSVIIPITEEDLTELADRDTVRVKFKLNQFETTADYFTFVTNDGTTLARLSFDNYMAQFLSERFVDIELDKNQAEGLKIPVTSLTTKDFYKIPVDFLTKGGESSENGFNVETVGEDGEVTSRFVAATIYYSTDEYYYIDTGLEDIPSGSYLLKPDSSDRYMVGETEPLTGVYNVNSGYAIFRRVDILEQNEEYCIVSDSTPYGLSVYDHIVLDASTVNEDDIIY